MRWFLLAISLATPLAAQPAAPLSLEHRMLLRCSAAFAMGAQRQAAGTQEAHGWPELGAGGQAFFLRAAARVMDEAALDRAALAAALTAEAEQLASSGTLADVLSACLPLLPQNAAFSPVQAAGE